MNENANTAIQCFGFEDHLVRSVDRGGQPWFVAADVCRVLEISEAHRATASLDEDEKGRHTVTTLGGAQEMVVISESGLYALAFKSRKAKAKLFRKWVTNEVIPAIRKTGIYAAPNAPATDIVAVAALLTKVVDQVAHMQATLAMLVERATKERRALPSPGVLIIPAMPAATNMVRLSDIDWRS